MRNIDKFCRYCKKDRIRSLSGYIICDCKPAKKEWQLEIQRESLKKQLSILGKELSELKESAEKTNKEKEC